MDRKKILIVDDEINIRLLVSSMLGKDYIVLKAADGEEAINIARDSKPDLILMDILMPKVDGYAAMTSERPYRRAMSAETAYTEIERCKNTQFDPKVADAFLRTRQFAKSVV